MPYTSTQVEVGTTSVKIVAPQASRQHIIIHDHDHNSSTDVYIGGSDVTITNGLHVPKTETIQLEVMPGDDLWAVADDDSVELHILAIRQ